MANRCALTQQIELLSGPISAATYFDGNWNNPVTALNNSSLGYVNGIATDSGSANNYIVASVFGSATSYQPGMAVEFIPANTNTGSSTLTVDSLAAASILDFAGNALAAGAIQANKLTKCTYIAGNFRLQYSTIPQLFYSNPVVTGGAQTTTINTLSAPWVSICYDASGGNSNATFTINVTNVISGCHMAVQIIPLVNTQAFKWTGTDNAGNSISDIRAVYANGSGASFVLNLITNGDASSNVLSYEGAYMRNTAGAGSSRLRFLAGGL